MQALPAPLPPIVTAPPNGRSKPRKRTGALDELSHPLLGDEPTLQLLPDRSEITGAPGVLCRNRYIDHDRRSTH